MHVNLTRYISVYVLFCSTILLLRRLKYLHIFDLIDFCQKIPALIPVLHLQTWTSARSVDRYALRLLDVRTHTAHTGVSAKKVLSRQLTARHAKVTGIDIFIE